jgi:hypothetical protein
MQNSNYNAFKFNRDNRDISEANISKIMQSILAIGFIKSRSVIVDKNMLIIDGHHRFLALKRLEMPIFYEIEEHASLEVLLHLNSSQQTWKLEDYIILFAKKQSPSYVNIVSVKNKYRFTYSNAVIICTNNTGAGASPKDVRQGLDLEINKNQKALINLLLFSKDHLPYSFKNHFIIALKTALLKLNDDQMEKLKDSLSSIREQTSTINYLVTFENIVNRKVRENKKVNLTGK